MSSIQLLTTKNNKYIEREFDELLHEPVYGWTVKTRQPVYKPKQGIIRTPPIFKNAGSRWKKVLLHRFEQQSFYGGDDDLDLDDFDGTFHNSIIKKMS